jgi:hypothetical protein
MPSEMPELLTLESTPYINEQPLRMVVYYQFVGGLLERAKKKSAPDSF